MKKTKNISNFDIISEDYEFVDDDDIYISPREDSKFIQRLNYMIKKQSKENIDKNQQLNLKIADHQKKCLYIMLGKDKKAYEPGYICSIFSQTHNLNDGVNIRIDKNGNTALHYILNPDLACADNREEVKEKVKNFLQDPFIIDEVLRLNINRSIKNDDGYTAEDIATEEDIILIIDQYYGNLKKGKLT